MVTANDPLRSIMKKLVDDLRKILVGGDVIEKVLGHCDPTDTPEEIADILTNGLLQSLINKDFCNGEITRMSLTEKADFYQFAGLSFRESVISEIIKERQKGN